MKTMSSKRFDTSIAQAILQVKQARAQIARMKRAVKGLSERLDRIGLALSHRKKGLK